MLVQTEHRFTVTDYHRMGETGVLRPDARVELLDGKIIDMSPIGPFHGGLAKRLSRIFNLKANGRWIVSTQDPLRLDDHSEPEPDVMLLKPSPDAPVVAAHFVDLLLELGLPAGVLNFVPGEGTTVGEALVTDPRTRFIAFTGSKGVGLRINELAARSAPGQRWIKRVIAELGGKDAIVVADDADLDAAVAGVVVWPSCL